MLILDPKSRTQPDRQKGQNTKMNYKSESNKPCPVCGQDHSPVTVGLEHGGFITTSPPPRSSPQAATKSKSKTQGHIFTPDIFWPEEEVEDVY